MPRARIGLIALSAALLGGCPASEHALTVDLSTDYSPRAEFDRVAVTLDGEAVADLAVDPDTDYVRGIRAAELTDVAAGAHRVEVTLLAQGSPVASRPIAVDVVTDQVVTALITRSCRDIDCPEACLAGQCVDAECTPETPERCPVEPECGDAADCVDGASCSEARCESGACLYAERPMACGPEAYCDPDEGCLPTRPPPCTGCPDPSFGDAGTVRLDFGGLATPWTNQGVSPGRDGRLYVIARAGDAMNGDIAVARLEPDGQLDATWGVDGIATVDVDSDDRAHMVTELASGDVAVCGESAGRGVVARFDPAGALVPTFGSSGVALLDIAPNADLFNGCAEMTDGRIVASGQAFFDPPNASDLQTVAFTASGALDPAFGDGGSVAEHVGQGDEFGSALRDPSDRIVAYGSTWQGSPTGHDCLLIRYTADGARDPSFGVGGLAIVDLGNSTNRCEGVTVAPSGGLVAASGFGLNGGETDAIVYRFTEVGALDLAFASDGVAEVDLGCDDSARVALELPDGRIAAAATGCAGGAGPTGAVLLLSATGAHLDTWVLEGTSQATGLAVDGMGRLLAYAQAGSNGAYRVQVTRFLP